MAKTTTKALGLVLAGAGVCGLWALVGDDDEATGTRNVVNQVWIERAPDDQRDMINHLMLVEVPEGRLGAAGRSSQWRHMVELFQWGLEGHRLSVFFPQERVKAQLKVRSWKCKGEAPAPFELCLEISNGRRSAQFYSLEEWKIDPERPRASLAELRKEHPEIAGALPPVATPVQVSAEELASFGEADLLSVLLPER